MESNVEFFKEMQEVQSTIEKNVHHNMAQDFARLSETFHNSGIQMRNDIVTDVKEIVFDFKENVKGNIYDLKEMVSKLELNTEKRISAIEKDVEKTKGNKWIQWTQAFILFLLSGIIVVIVIIFSKETKIENITIEHIVKTTIPNDPNQ